LDSGFAPAYIHAVEIALHDNDPIAALRYVRGYLVNSPMTRDGVAMDLLSTLLEHRHRRHPDFERELRAASPATLRRIALAVAFWPDENETQLLLWPYLLQTVPGRRVAAGTGLNGWRATYAWMIPILLTHRGHLQEARRAVGNRLSMPFMQLANLGVIPPETVEVALEHWLRYPTNENLTLHPLFTAAPCSQTMDAALWWAARKDTIRLQRLAAQEELRARSERGRAADVATRLPVPGFVRAAFALAQGDSALALKRFQEFPDSACPDAWQLREARFRLLAARGRSAEAAAVFDHSHDRWVPLVLERARLAERLRDRPTALKYYRFVTQAWIHADPELQPIVRNARAAIVRLRG
jgi:hypothetical protein